MSQWRSSWLSREGLLAVLTYIPALLFAAGWDFGRNDGPWILAGRQLPFRARHGLLHGNDLSMPEDHSRWHNRFTVPGYLAMAMATGGLWILPILALSGSDLQALAFPIVGFLLLSAMIKWRYWNVTDNTAPTELPGPRRTPILKPCGCWKVPTTSETYVMREMGYRIGRKHALKLRRLAGFFVVIPVAILDRPRHGAPASWQAAWFCSQRFGQCGRCGGTLAVAVAKHVLDIIYGEELV